MVTLGRMTCDVMYRVSAPWEGADRPELRRLVADGAPSTATAQPWKGCCR